MAKTGQGKTLAFAIPILQELSVDPYGVFAVVLTPTRELAAQIGDSFASVGAGMGLRFVVVTGGRDTIRQSQDLDRRPHVVVATPGRILDLMEKQVANMSKCRMLVLDEADKLLSQDFKGMLDKVISFLPRERQILLYSATFPLTVESFMRKHLHEPYEINLMDELTLKGITQYYAFVQERQKVHCLNTLFSKLQINQVRSQ